MSCIAGNNEQSAPPAKKHKCDEDLIDFGGPVEDEATARMKLEEAGFDPDDLNKRSGRSKLIHNIHPMSHFCLEGDLRMCRYLLSKDASTSTKGWYFPMMTAAMGGKLDVCKWLYDHGADDDTRRLVPGADGDASALFYACRSSGEDHINVGKWLILKGALSGAGSTSESVDRKIMRDAFKPLHDSKYYVVGKVPAAKDIRPVYLSWAHDIASAHESYFTFLCGVSVAPPSFSEGLLLTHISKKLQNAKAASSIVASMSRETQLKVWGELIDSSIRRLLGETGLLRLIADFAGVVRMEGRELRIIRALEHELRLFIEAAPFHDDGDSTDWSSSSDSSDISDSESE